MISWLIAAVIGASAALFQYGRHGPRSTARRAGLAVLRAAAIALAIALLLNAPLGRARTVLPWTLVDASLSMTRGGADLWSAAWDSAMAVASESLFVFGDTVARADRSGSPAAAMSRLRPVAERTMAAGRPVVVITDGELQDSSALDDLSSGSRVIVLQRAPQRDAALVTLEAPRAAVDGDSVGVRLTLAAGSRGAAAGTVTLHLDQTLLGRWPLEAMSAWSERQLDVRVRATGAPARRAGSGAGPGVLRAVVASASDEEPRNDTLASTIEISRAAAAVFVSTSPDQDARFALAVLRGTLALPTRGFLRVAPGMWRHEGTLSPSTEAEVRQALRDAPVAILHGDTGIFGPPQSAAPGPMALIAPPESEDGEWYPSAAPISPLSGQLAAIPLESLPPVSTGASAVGDWTALEVRRGREQSRRAVVVGRDAPRRMVTITGAGFWRWRFRGGASADAYAALWGGIFDWLAAERADRRAAVPDESGVRAGQAVRWRRGSSADSVVRAVLQRRISAYTDTLTLRFPPGVAIRETPPLEPGTYDVVVPGGRTTLVVNNAAELLPSRPLLQSGSVGRRPRPDDAPRARSAAYLYALLIALLCAEWIARRRAGLR